MWAIAWVATARADTVELGKKVVAVDLQSPSGNVRLRTDPDALRVTVERTDKLDPKLCDLKITEKGDTATVVYGPRSAAQPEKCAAEFTVVLPTGGRAKVAVTQGAIDVDGVDGALDLWTGRGDLAVRSSRGSLTASVPEGDVRLDDAGGDLSLDVGRGQVRGGGPATLSLSVREGVIELGGLSGPANVVAWKGRVLLTYTGVPTGTIEARATGGPVVVDLPGSPTVTCHVAATGGTALCELPQAADAPLTVHAIADGGAVRVH